ncbi:hypothetical protein HOC90_04235 [Candidatus Falkowbacteria bacterium]|jgi:hypothetical protein|nr:hypothetical protein [Elusimicrobiaceae bacterium]MBT4433525.1 hypothetical protein [Candidatus Falkowbacteria bacterium]
MHLPELDYKKIALVIGFLLVTFFFGFLIYLFFFRPMLVSPPANINEEIPPTNTVRNLNTNGSLPSDNNTNKAPGRKSTEDDTADGGLTRTKKIVTDGVKGVEMDLDNNQVVYYNRHDGKFYKINKNGESVLLSEKTFFDVRNITWSLDKDTVIMEYPDGSNIAYNFEAEKQTTLPLSWEEFEFAPDNNKVITKTYGSRKNDNQLIIADLKTGQAKIIEGLGDKGDNFQIAWSPDNQVVAFFTETIDFDHQEVYFIGQHSENFKSIIVDGLGFQGKWSPKGDKILYSVYNSTSNYEPTLWITSKSGAYKKRLFVNTWAEKCTFYSDNIIYCGVPQQLGEMMGLSPNYALKVDDDIYRIDIDRNMSEKIATPETGHNIEKLMVDENEKTLYFSDRRTGRLYQIDL